MPEISIVLPAWNAARTIERAIHSLLTQTFEDFELIVVNDGSTDSTGAIVKRFSDPRVRLISQTHEGVWSAANCGMRAARAATIARMDADDVSWPTRLEKQHNLLRSGYDVVGCCVRIVREEGRQLRTVPSYDRYTRWINEETLTARQIRALRFVEFPLVNPTLMANRGYWGLLCRDDCFPEDYDLMLRAAAEGMTFGKVDEVLFDWFDSDARLTRRDSRYTSEAFMNCRRQRFLEGPLEGVTRVDLWGAGRTGKPWLRWLQQHGITVRRVYEVNPRKTGTTIHGVPVWSPDDMPPADGTMLVVAVGAAGARSLIQDHIASRGYESGENTWFVA